MPQIGRHEGIPPAPEETEQALIVRAAGGDAAAFDALLALHEPHVRRLAYRLLGWRDQDLDDAVQDVFVRLLERIGSFRGEARLGTWLTTLTLNRCRTIRRRRWTRLRFLHRQHAPAAQGGADAHVLRDEASSRVRRAVASLKEKDHQVIVLFHLEGQSIAEIAGLLGVSRGAVEVRLHRARAKLKGLLSDLVDE